MLGSSASGGRWLRLAQVISLCTNPLLLALPLYLVVALASAPTRSQGVLLWTITSLGVSAAPLVFVWRGVRLGRYTDHHVSHREQRLIPLLFALGCMVVTFTCLLLLKASSALLATVTAMIVSFVSALLITQWAQWKISLHVLSITGAILTLGLVLGPLLFLLTPVLVLVGWCRWLVHAHTLLQALAGMVLAASVTLTTFWLLGLFPPV